MLIDRHSSLLLVVDIQERLAPRIDNADNIIEKNSVLLRAASQLEIPYLITEQYPQGLGCTVAPLLDFVNRDNIYEKIHFSACREEKFNQRIQEMGKQQILITGTESHVCVLQTAILLKAQGYQVFVIEDAVGSRQESSKQAALCRLREAGAVCVTTEMVVFEWLERADSESFRSILPLIK